jgi:hypothetical protein
VYNVPGVVSDGSPFTNGGLDGGGRAYSGNLLGKGQTVGGTAFTLAAANVPSAVSSVTVPLPAGQFAALKILATAVNGNQLSQTFAVSYTDGTSQSFTQSLSDWCTPQLYSGESQAVPMTYRDNSDGTRDSRGLGLYGYSFTLASGKTVKSIALPNNRNIVVLSMSLSGTVSASVTK